MTKQLLLGLWDGVFKSLRGEPSLFLPLIWRGRGRGVREGGEEGVGGGEIEARGDGERKQRKGGRRRGREREREIEVWKYWRR